MLAFLVISAAGLCGYFQSPAIVWAIAAVGLLSASLAEHSAILRRAIVRGNSEVAYDALARSATNAVVATGAAYWSGIATRMLSGL